MTTDQATAAAAAQPAEPAFIGHGTWKLLRAGSTVGFRVKKMGLYHVKGRFRTFDGHIEFAPESSSPSGELTLDAKSVSTRMPPRDWHLRTNDFLAAKQHPRIRVRAARIKPDGHGAFNVPRRSSSEAARPRSTWPFTHFDRPRRKAHGRSEPASIYRASSTATNSGSRPRRPPSGWLPRTCTSKQSSCSSGWAERMLFDLRGRKRTIVRFVYGGLALLFLVGFVGFGVGSEGEGALEQRLADLEGHPVVVNQWASWCTPCRFEFPFFREAIERYGDRVAFVGLDSQDERAAAEEFLVEVPVGFPSIFDPDASVAASLGGARSWPTTFFFDADGDQIHTRIGAYATQELLEQDIERFALAEG